MGSGCFTNQSTTRPLSDNSLVTQLQKLKHVCQLEQQRKQKSFRQQQDLLVGEFGKGVKSRSSVIQKAMIGRTAYTKNIKIIYFILENQVKKILDYKDKIQKWQTIDTLISSINTLVYSSSFLNDEELTKFTQLFRHKFPQYKEPVDADIRHELIRYHKQTDQVTFEMENTFIMEFSNRYNIQIPRINQAGHKYKFAAGTISYVLT